MWILFGRKLLACILFYPMIHLFTKQCIDLQHLIERSWYAVTETCLAFTVFRDDFSPRFVALFTILLFVKCFHWLAEDRVDYVSITYGLVSWLISLKMIVITDIFKLSVTIWLWWFILHHNINSFIWRYSCEIRYFLNTQLRWVLVTLRNINTHVFGFQMERSPVISLLFHLRAICKWMFI